MDPKEMVGYVTEIREAIVQYVSSIAERFDKQGSTKGKTTAYLVRNIAENIKAFDLNPYVVKIPAGEQALLVKLYRQKFKEAEAVVLKNFDLVNRNMLHSNRCNLPDGKILGDPGCTCIPAHLIVTKEDNLRMNWIQHELDSSKYSVNFRKTPDLITVTTNREGGARKRIYTSDKNLRDALDTARRGYNGS